MLGRLKQALAKTRRQILKGVEDLFLGKKAVDSEVLTQLEETLLAADLGVKTTQQLLEQLRERVDRHELADLPSLKHCLKQFLLDILQKGEGRLALDTAPPHSAVSRTKVREAALSQGLDPGSFRPFVIMVVGVNGTGKTTTIAKLAHRFRQEGRSVLLAAGDTFRAAAIEQLEVWGSRVGVPVIKHQSGSDPAAVLFDAVMAARARGVDVLIADTAGRLHTQFNLMEEIKKIKRVMGKALPGAPQEILLVMDATTGQNALAQARRFHEAVGVTGVVLTKLDGTAKGGMAVPIIRELGIPIKLMGVGEGMEDLEDFSAKDFAEALFGDE